MSQSVIVLSLHYVYRLKQRNEFTVGRRGSEFRVAVVALMMANKFIDECVSSLADVFFLIELTFIQQYVYKQNMVRRLWNRLGRTKQNGT